MQGALTRKKSHGMAPLWALMGPYRGPIDPRMQALLEATQRESSPVKLPVFLRTPSCVGRALVQAAWPHALRPCLNALARLLRRPLLALAGPSLAQLGPP